jgi:hypothetical protein
VCRLQTARRPLMSQSEKPFNVSDRRHFTTDGRPRDDAEESPVPEAQSGSAPQPASPPRSPGAAADFSQFLLSLASQAGMLLSGEGLPEGTDPAGALEGARSIIAILDMLKEKTEGRRTAPEETLLDELLFQLRMAYVEKTRAGGA